MMYCFEAVEPDQFNNTHLINLLVSTRTMGVGVGIIWASAAELRTWLSDFSFSHSQHHPCTNSIHEALSTIKI